MAVAQKHARSAIVSRSLLAKVSMWCSRSTNVWERLTWSFSAGKRRCRLRLPDAEPQVAAVARRARALNPGMAATSTTGTKTWDG